MSKFGQGGDQSYEDRGSDDNLRWSEPGRRRRRLGLLHHQEAQEDARQKGFEAECQQQPEVKP